MGDVAAEFERCWPWLEASLNFVAFQHDGRTYYTHDKHHVLDRIMSKRCLFWPGEASAIVTELQTSPTGLVTHHTWLAGGELAEIVAAMPAVEDWGRRHGAVRQVGSGRRGWLRAFEGYREIGVRKEKSLL